MLGHITREEDGIKKHIIQRTRDILVKKYRCRGLFPLLFLWLEIIFCFFEEYTLWIDRLGFRVWCNGQLHGHFLTNVTLPSRWRHRMGNPSYQNHSAGPKQGVNVIPTFPYGNVSIQQSLYVNVAMQSPHSAVPTTSRLMLKIDEFGRSWFKFYSHN